MKHNIIAVVVTYNRKKLLLECLDAVLSQTYPVSGIILIDNASTDGTSEELQNKGYFDNELIDYIKMDTNTGGAGGFYEGVQRSCDKSCDWVWIMDDDTIPSESCLEELIHAYDILAAKSKEVSFLASAVYGENGEYMNLPEINLTPSENGYAYWYEFLSQGMVSVANATFVSVLINKKAIDVCGLPCKDYFIWGDDTEYTTRLTHFFGDAYFVGKSIAIHKRVGAKALNIDEVDNEQRIGMFRYLYRNQMITNRYYNKNFHYKIRFLKEVLKSLRYIGKKNGILRMRTIVGGYWQGLVQYKKFFDYINGQLKQV